MKEKKTTEQLDKSLDDFHKLFASKNFKFILFYGTLLGIYRDKCLINGDDDVDILVDKGSFDKVFDFVQSKGFSIISQCNPKKLPDRFISIQMPYFIQLKIDGNLIDIYSYKTTQDDRMFIQKDKSFYPCSLIFPTKTVIYNTNIYNIPQNTPQLLEYHYGEKWSQKIPKSQYKTIVVNGKHTLKLKMKKRKMKK